MNVNGVLFGSFLIVLGLLFIRLGHSSIGKYQLKGGTFLKLFTPNISRFQALFLGWAIGLLFIWLGISLLLSGGRF
jgi:hypothetical protein